MKLLFVIKSLSLKGGGAERVLAEVTAGLVAREYSVSVATFDSPALTDFYLLHPQIVRSRLGVGDIQRPSRLPDMVRQVAALRRAIKETTPDAIVGFMHSAYIPLCLAAAGTGIPVIASEHTVYGHYSDKPVQRALLRLVARLPYTFIGISDDVRRGFPEPIRRRMVIIPNPVTSALPDRADVIGGEEKVLLSIGRLSEEKGHQTLISAFAQISGKFPEWRLRIIGDGVLRRELEGLVTHLGLQDRVFLPGATTNTKAEYLRAQLFVVPSVYESFGLATAEALAHGLPAIGFADCPGINALIIHERNGLLLRGPDRVSALKEGLTRLMGSAQDRVRMADAAPALLDAFSPPKIVDLWVALLTKAAGRSSQSQ